MEFALDVNRSKVFTCETGAVSDGPPILELIMLNVRPRWLFEFDRCCPFHCGVGEPVALCECVCGWVCLFEPVFACVCVCVFHEVLHLLLFLFF